MGAVTRAYVGLGANVGDRLAALRGAAERLDARAETEVVAASAVYQTEALVLDGADPQPDHLNAVLALETALSPRALLRVLRGIERAAGRDHDRERWAPRPLDLDLLIYGTRRVALRDLQVPHPALAERAFVLRPLADVAADVAVPGTARTVRELLDACADAGRVDATAWHL